MIQSPTGRYGNASAKHQTILRKYIFLEKGKREEQEFMDIKVCSNIPPRVFQVYFVVGNSK